MADLENKVATLQQSLDSKSMTIEEMNAELKKAAKYQLFYQQRKQKKYRNCGS